MASYAELHDLSHDSALLDRVEMAVVVAAHSIIGGGAGNQAQRNKWAGQALAAPRVTASKLLPGVLAANKDATVENIKAATDSVIQGNVDSLVDLFADLITNPVV
jgi:hypothetical protein